ncbi:LysR family transcriptional regulator [Methylobacterium sp. J-030]|uniref:LysR family transcriptional regulator n=1 Tax=Methylobacterium sp. J-030 TaxID=2836627 RepID=UPI001FBBFF1A|nr:LysR family transcriptional regulator [Methylobacterium sp. J-030]MCJ2072434.1 LysR family transcriptional regulator [Methylobacterium sp. J-030]
MTLDYADLRLFLGVVEAGSITLGARRANMSLPTASGRIRRIEERFRVKLLERHRLGVRPTDAGRTLHAHALHVLGTVQRMNEDLASFAYGQRGLVRLLSNTHALSEFLPDDVGAFLRTRADVSVSIEERSSQEIAEAVAAGTADVGVIAGLVETSELKTYPYRVDHLVAAVPTASDLPSSRPVDFIELLDSFEFVGLGPTFALPHFLDQHARRAAKSVRQRVQVGSFDAICRLVATGIGIGIVPGAAARRLKATLRFRAVDLSNGWARRELRLCTRASGELTGFASELIAWLRAEEGHNAGTLEVVPRRSKRRSERDRR